MTTPFQPGEPNAPAVLEAAVADAVPLIVDVDGTLLRADLLWEGLAHLLLRRPLSLPGLPLALLRGKAAFKAYVARRAGIAVEHMPRNPAVTDLIEAAHAEGRPVILASAAHRSQLAGLAQHVGATDYWGSDDRLNLAGAAKLERIRGSYAAYDYVGNGAADLPLWQGARRAWALDASAATLRRARRQRPDLEVLGSPRRRGRAWLRALRPHQWAKNTLLFLPALAAHIEIGAAALGTAVAGFLAFSLLASAVYLVNDLSDLANDRTHPKKRTRPLASGEVSIPGALGGAIALVLVSAAIALRLPPAFQLVLAGYFALTTAYSFDLKRRAILDVITLAALYATRVVAGAAMFAVPLSRWFLAFSVFFFFSLALVKRVVELMERPEDDNRRLAGRGYHRADAAALTSLGSGAVAGSSLVYCLYITGDEVGSLYAYPDLLWLGLPLLLYWQARIWMLTGRGSMNEDPVLFAVRDRVSHLVAGAFLLVLWLAA